MPRPTRLVPTVTVVTKAMMDAIAANAREIVLEDVDHYPRAFERWPMDKDVGKSLAIPCEDL